jgi:DnaK suppressor protein
MLRKDALLKLTSQLTARRDALRKTLDGELDNLLKVTEEVEVGDQVDSANDEICSQLVEIESRELAQIEHALQRIALGVYGRCEACGGRIPAARLNALPYTNRCIKCERENENREHSETSARVVERSVEADEGPIAEGESDEQIDRRDVVKDLRGSGHRPVGHFLG